MQKPFTADKLHYNQVQNDYLKRLPSKIIWCNSASQDQHANYIVPKTSIKKNALFTKDTATSIL
jgi:hypothetical protein